MLLSIIIINYKTPLMVKECISGLFTFTRGIQFEVIVVDNNSGDKIQEILELTSPEVRFIQMGYNAGFARANNAGIKLAKGDSVLLLNSDTIIEDNAIGNCFTQFVNSNFIACGVQLLNSDRTPQISGNYVMKGGLNYLLPLPYTGKILKFIATMFKVKKPNVPNATATIEVDWINGAFLMVKKTAIDKAGLLDEDFFLYAEEAEWCSRLKKQGHLCIYGNCNVIHLQGESANETFDSTGKGYFNLFDKKGLQIMISNFLRIRKQFGIGWFLFDLFIYLLTIPFFLIILVFSRLLFFQKPNYSLKQWTGFTRNVFVLCKFSGKMLSNTPYFYKFL